MLEEPCPSIILSTAMLSGVTYKILTISGESQLIADNGCILIVPVVITYCTIPPSNTHLNSTSHCSHPFLIVLYTLLIPLQQPHPILSTGS